MSTLNKPVLVRVSYYPRWHVSGAQGPYRVSPNFMVVIPTQHHVVLTYGTDPALNIGLVLSGLSVAGIVSIAVLTRRLRNRNLPPSGELPSSE